MKAADVVLKRANSVDSQIAAEDGIAARIGTEAPSSSWTPGLEQPQQRSSSSSQQHQQPPLTRIPLSNSSRAPAAPHACPPRVATNASPLPSSPPKSSGHSSSSAVTNTPPPSAQRQDRSNSSSWVRTPPLATELEHVDQVYQERFLAHQKAEAADIAKKSEQLQAEEEALEERRALEQSEEQKLDEKIQEAKNNEEGLKKAAGVVGMKRQREQEAENALQLRKDRQAAQEKEMAEEADAVTRSEQRIAQREVRQQLKEQELQKTEKKLEDALAVQQEEAKRLAGREVVVAAREKKAQEEELRIAQERQRSATQGGGLPPAVPVSGFAAAPQSVGAVIDSTHPATTAGSVYAMMIPSAGSSGGGGFLAPSVSRSALSPSSRTGAPNLPTFTAGQQLAGGGAWGAAAAPPPSSFPQPGLANGAAAAWESIDRALGASGAARANLRVNLGSAAQAVGAVSAQAPEPPATGFSLGVAPRQPLPPPTPPKAPPPPGPGGLGVGPGFDASESSALLKALQAQAQAPPRPPKGPRGGSTALRNQPVASWTSIDQALTMASKLTSDQPAYP